MFASRQEMALDQSRSEPSTPIESKQKKNIILQQERYNPKSITEVKSSIN